MFEDLDMQTVSFGSEHPSTYLPGQASEQPSVRSLQVIHQNGSGGLITRPLERPLDNGAFTNTFDSEYSVYHFGHWQGSGLQLPAHQLQHSYHTPSIRSSSSSSSSHVRSSNNGSIFSHHPLRDSVASTNTTWSQASQPNREHFVSEAERLLNGDSSTILSHQENLLPQSSTVPVHRRSTQRQSNYDREQFATCVSKTKRSRRTTKEPRYWCTSCEEGFREKYDWKRHEETFQERIETFECDLCKKTYFLEKDFVHHHRESHRCRTCIENDHVGAGRRKRQRRTGWGCGFCLHYDSDWTERCNHIASHYEKDKCTIKKWSQTQVIMSLLHQPHLREHWAQLIVGKEEPNPCFGWSSRWAGRAEGYPDTDRSPQLQDLLEFFTPDQNASALVALAYEMGHQSRLTNGLRQIQHTHQVHPAKVPHQHASRSRHTSPDKELPLLPPEPPVPPKDSTTVALPPHFDINAHSTDFAHWDRLMNTIPEDDLLPDAGPIQIRDLNFSLFHHR